MSSRSITLDNIRYYVGDIVEVFCASRALPPDYKPKWLEGKVIHIHQREDDDMLFDDIEADTYMCIDFYNSENDGNIGDPDYPCDDWWRIDMHGYRYPLRKTTSGKDLPILLKALKQMVSNA